VSGDAPRGNGGPSTGGTSGGTRPPATGAGAGARGGMRRGPGGGGPGHALVTPTEKARDFWGTMRRLVRTMRPERLRIGGMTLLGIVSVVFAVIAPRILGHATNIIVDGVFSKRIPAGTTKAQAIAYARLHGQERYAHMMANMDLHPGHGVDFRALALTLLLVAAIYVASAAFGWAQQFLMVGVAQRTVYRLRRAADEKLGRLPLRYFDDHPHGDILSRVTNDLDNIAQSLQQALTTLITSVLTIIGVLIMMFLISPLLAAISVIIVPVSFAITVVIARRSQKLFAVQWERTGDVGGHVEEMFTGHNIVKVFGHQREAIERFDEHNEELYRASFGAQFISGIIQPIMMFVSNLNYVAIAVIGGIKVANGSLSLGDVQAFFSYSRQFTMPITQVASIVNVLQSTAASSERVFELLDESEEEADPAAPVALEHTEGRISFEDVSFRYVADQPLIGDLGLEVEPGETVAIVGPTGAGKTTLVNLLLRFYEIDHGRISIDGVDTRQMARGDLRRLFGMVLQDTWLFSGTVRDNITYGRDGATEEQMLAAAKAARVDHFVRTLPQGYDTVLDENATAVSQGEKQLLTIARAFLADPDILILDEATSSVDTRTEVLIQQAMSELMKDRTSFVIAHRLSTIRGADIILCMDHGRIVEQGSHEELLERRGFYFDLYNAQFAAALDEAL